MLLTKDFYKGLVGSIHYLVLGDPGAAPPPLPPPWIHADYIKGIKFKVRRMYVYTKDRKRMQHRDVQSLNLCFCYC